MCCHFLGCHRAGGGGCQSEKLGRSRPWARLGEAEVVVVVRSILFVGSIENVIVLDSVSLVSGGGGGGRALELALETTALSNQLHYIAFHLKI